MVTDDLRATIRNIPDFPKKGIVFRDITTLLKDKNAFQNSIDLFYEKYKSIKIDKVVSVESRGFIFGSVLAYKLGAGFVPVRKPKKLPSKTISEEYDLEYGKDKLEIHLDSISQGENIIIVDDLLATGGTMNAACRLVEKLGGNIIGLAFLIELSFLNGREKLSKYQIDSLLKYDSE
ncbi:MAG: adenine phosphoribosyltransferase [Ignavibacteriales bacterium]|nr:adenine phosphoribosyltransferase [Ignavibacteriales bacterium]